MKNKLPLRERKKIQVRNDLIQAAMELFTKNGFEQTTVDDIVDAADLSRRTFFRYFPSKDLIVFPHQEVYLDFFRDLLAENRGEEEPIAALRRASQTMARQYQSAREDHLIQQRIIQQSPTLIARGDKMDEEWEAVIAAELIARKDQTNLSDRHARFLAGAVMGLYRVVLREWYASNCRADLGKMGDEAMSLIEFGIHGDRGGAKTKNGK